MASKKDFIAAKSEVSDLLLGGILAHGNLVTTAFGSVTVAALGGPTLRGCAGDAMPNVHAVGVGRKLVSARATDDLAVRVYVQRKLPNAELGAGQRIPASIAGLPMDVIESPPARILEPLIGVPPAAGAAAGCNARRQARQRPVQPGISAGHIATTAGTIACFCRSTEPHESEQVLVLSNNHVFADVNRGQAGDILLQPGVADKGAVPWDAFAQLERWHPIALGAAATNRVDAAVGRVTPATPIVAEICSIGPVAGTLQGEEDLVVCKHGRTSGYTEGVIADESYDVLVRMDPYDPQVVARFVGQLRIQTIAPHKAFALGGDSGSLVLDRGSRRAVGLYFAGPCDGSYGIANQIHDVLALLRLAL